MYKILTLTRASWIAATTYRLNTILSLLGLLATVVPLYFVANALQPIMAESISQQADHYFGFVLVGMIVFSFITVALSSIPGAIGGGITTGTLEALLCTRTRLPAILAGLVGYQFTWTMVRALVLLVAGTVLGARFAWGHLPLGLAILALIILAYLAIGIMGAASILAFRTTGPLVPAVLTVSTLLGGVYYPTNVIPSWIERLSAFVPLTYGLRALRGAVLNGASLGEVLPDVAILLAFVVGLLVVSSWLFLAAFRYARRAGTLSQY